MARGRKKKNVTRKLNTSTSAVDLSSMSLVALRKLRTSVDEQIAVVQVEEVARLREEFENKAARLGMSVTDIVGNATRKRRKAKTSAGARRRGGASKKLFVNPADSSLTWSGRGRRPRWINDFLAGGGSLESIRG